MGKDTIVGLIIVIPVIFLYVFLLKNQKKLDALSPEMRKLNKAKKMGHIVTATCVLSDENRSNIVSVKNNVSDYNYALHYEYYVNGQRYIYKTISGMGARLGGTLTLYYLDNPRRAFEDPKFGGVSSLIILFVPIFVGVIIALFLQSIGLLEI